jgi:hypothetical protein
VTVVPEGMLALAEEPGTLPPLQLLPVDQLPLAPPTQVTVAAGVV